MSAAPRPLDVAFSLARHGFHVFPVSRRKVPLVKGWESVASRDPEQIATWWTVDYPDALVGYACGLSGVVVGDLDRDKPFPEQHPRAGEQKGAGADNLDAAGIVPPPTFTYPTPSGGTHLVYRAPEGRALTIAADTPVDGVDVRAGNGFAIYYGKPLKVAPTLAPAPDWLLVDAKPKAAKRGESATVDAWVEAVPSGKPSKAVRKALQAVTNDLKHDAMLEVVGELVKLGTAGERGAAEALDAGRAVYVEGRPDRGREWDNAVDGSVKHHGLPPVTFALSKAERKALAKRVKATPTVMETRETRAAETAVAHDEDLTDAALAETIAEELDGRFAVAHGLGLMRYDGKRWAQCDELVLIEVVRKTLRRVRAEETRAAILAGDKRREADARTLEQRTRIVAVARLALGMMTANASATDAHPDLLNTPSGVVDLRTGELKPHDPALMLTRMTAAPYDPDADRSTWLRALEAVPPKVAAWLQVRMGQAATGHTPDDAVMPIFMGGGENGKTTLLHAPKVTLGDYAVRVPDRLFMANPGDHPTELTTLMGARLAIAEELAEGRNLNVKRVKDTLGTPELTARQMRRDNVTWRATHALMLSTNYLPVVAETDHGTWRRLALVVFPYRFVSAAELKRSKSSADRLRDETIKAALEQPDAGVLAWLVDGARAWYANGRRMPAMPKRVVRDTLAWRHDADPVLAYIAERIVTGEQAEGWAIPSVDLAADFNEWIEQRGHRAWSLQTINARFAGHEALRDVQRKGVRFGTIVPSRPAFALRALPKVTNAWVGIRFAPEPGPTVPPSREVAAYGLGEAD